MTVNELLTHTETVVDDDHLTAFRVMASEHKQLGDTEVWKFLTNALREIPCPSCVAHGLKPSHCKYCKGAGTVSNYRFAHPMSLLY